MSYKAPFQGYKVLDLSQGQAGPYCGMLLALNGADVIKIEPLHGDWSRILGKLYGEHSALSIFYNRGKRSMALDLKAPEGIDIAKRLSAECDILIESYRPGVASRLGLGYEEVKQVNPRVLYVSVSGFGQSGPYTALPCSDTVAQAFSGFMSVNKGADGIPHKVGFTVIDSMTGLYAFQAVSTALFAREIRSEPEGRHLDINLIQCAAEAQSPKIAEYYLEGGTPELLNAPAGSYRTSDGWIAISFVREEDFVRLCRAIDHEELPQDPRYTNFLQRAGNMDSLLPLLKQTFAQKTTEEWIARLTEADVLCSRINDYGDWLEDRQVKFMDAAPFMNHPGVGRMPVARIPGMLRAEYGNPSPPAPAISEHAREILTELGFSPEEVEHLGREGIVRLPK